jgi:hypothetical protein
MIGYIVVEVPENQPDCFNGFVRTPCAVYEAIVEFKRGNLAAHVLRDGLGHAVSGGAVNRHCLVLP